MFSFPVLVGRSFISFRVFGSPDALDHHTHVFLEAYHHYCVYPCNVIPETYSTASSGIANGHVVGGSWEQEEDVGRDWKLPSARARDALPKETAGSIGNLWASRVPGLGTRAGGVDRGSNLCAMSIPRLCVPNTRECAHSPPVYVEDDRTSNSVYFPTLTTPPSPADGTPRSERVAYGF